MRARRSAALVALVLGARAGLAAHRAPRLVVDAPVHDFGTVDRGAAVDHTFRLQNAGDAPLHIEHVKSSCGCTVAVVSGSDIAPNSPGEVAVRLDTARLSGRTTKTVTVYTNDPVAPVAPLTLTGQVIADVVLTPNPLYLGKVRHGEPVHRELTVASGRPGEPHAVTWIEHSNPAFRAAIEPASQGTPQRVAVDLDPDTPLGRLTDQLVIHTTSLREPTVVVPVFGSVEGDVVVLPPQVTFGITQGVDTPPRELYIRNRGARPVAVKSVTVPEGVVRYELSTVRDGVEYRLTLRLREGLPAGKVEGAVEIFTDHPDESHLVVPLYAIVRDAGRG